MTGAKSSLIKHGRDKQVPFYAPVLFKPPGIRWWSKNKKCCYRSAGDTIVLECPLPSNAEELADNEKEEEEFVTELSSKFFLCTWTLIRDRN